ncbi:MULTISPECIES: hypothetical protein [Rhizobium]|jgi:uncharacterized protein (UPF0254 family)|uniref:hypothetical protein n=1 Tax=Rhizobium TaxID=379 RepID=UPI000DD924AE|nr:hypothetical protein [Rhizobium sp. RHZ01]MBD9449627.1 hypothetical protein [Rhizobium sp. RHZ01]
MSSFASVVLLIASSLIASQTSAEEVGIETGLERSTPSPDQAYNEHKDQKQAAEERDGEVAEMARQALSKARLLTVPQLTSK